MWNFWIPNKLHFTFEHFIYYFLALTGLVTAWSWPDSRLTTSPDWPLNLLNNKSFAASVILSGNGLLPTFLYNLGKPTGDSKSSVNEAVHATWETIFSARV